MKSGELGLGLSGESPTVAIGAPRATPFDLPDTCCRPFQRANRMGVDFDVGFDVGSIADGLRALAAACPRAAPSSMEGETPLKSPRRLPCRSESSVNLSSKLRTREQTCPTE